MKAENQGQDGEHHCAGGGYVVRQDAQNPVVSAEDKSPTKQQQTHYQEQRDGREIAQDILLINAPAQTWDKKNGKSNAGLERIQI